MTTLTFPPIVVTDSLLSTTMKLLRRRAIFSPAHEQLTYWAGVKGSSAWAVTTVVRPHQFTSSGSVDVESVTNAHVIDFIYEHSLTIIAQVHSHPGRSVGHSLGDDLGAITPFPGLLSIIVPNYARDNFNFENSGVHRFDGRSFSLLNVEDAKRTLIIAPAITRIR
jgi:hypothetical protein